MDAVMTQWQAALFYLVFTLYCTVQYTAVPHDWSDQLRSSALSVLRFHVLIF